MSDVFLVGDAQLPSLGSVPVLPITDIRLLSKKHHCPSGYELIDRSIGGRSVHLGAPTPVHSFFGINSRYMCISRDLKNAQAGCMLVTSICLISDKVPVPEDHYPIAKTTDDKERGLPKGKLCLQYKGRHHCKRAIYDVCLVLVSHGERLPLGYETCGELNGVTIASRTSHYSSPIPKSPPIPPSETTSTNGQTTQLQSETKDDLGHQRNAVVAPGSETPAVDSVERKAPAEGGEVGLRRPTSIMREIHHPDQSNSPLDISRVSKEFRDVLSFAEPWVDRGAFEDELLRPKFASLTSPEPLESMPVKEKLYSHVSGDTISHLPFTLVGHYDLHRILAEVSDLPQQPIVDVDREYRYSFKGELAVRDGRKLEHRKKSRHHRKHHSSRHSHRKKSSHHSHKLEQNPHR